MCTKLNGMGELKWEKASHRVRPGALVQDQYVMALKYNDVTVGRVPKFLSKITYFYVKHGEDLVKMIDKDDFHTTLIKVR